MKKIFIVSAVVTAALAACQKAEVTAPSADAPVLYATIEETDATKTYMDGNNNIRWSEGDQVVAFMKTSLGLRYQIKNQYVGKTSGYFSQVSSGSTTDLGAGTEWDHNIVYYPYSDAVEAAKSGSSYTLDVVLPSEQTYAPESFGNGSMAMVAVSENNNITFRNVLGGMKLQLKGTQKVTSITIEGKNSEKLSGAATVTAYTDETKPAITMSSSASSSVTLDCGSGVQLSESTATEFIISLPPVAFSKGFIVTITDTDSKIYSIETDKANTVIRSSLLVMPEVLLESEQENEPQAIDYVDEYGVNHGKGVNIDGTIWAPVNCGYHKDKFEYGKLYQWGRKYGLGYSGELYDFDGNISGTYSDAYVVKDVRKTPSSLIDAQSEYFENYLFHNYDNYYDGLPDWCIPQCDKLWNSGTEDNPIKTEYDPCPKGWRVPTYTELSELCQNYSSWTSENGQNGHCFGANSRSESNSQTFFPAAGLTHGRIGGARGDLGLYWASSPVDGGGGILAFRNSSVLGTSNDCRDFAFSVRCVQDDSELILVSSVTLCESSLSLNAGEMFTLSATISPTAANHRFVYWSSDDVNIATVDQNGIVTAVAVGTTTITAVAGMQEATCKVVVVKAVSQAIDYVDEYGVNHGKGVNIDGIIWAPVNCGYHETDFKYGKLYQWGRKYGQGYSGELYDINVSLTGTYSDATVPTIESGVVSLERGNDKSNEGIFFTDWLHPQKYKLWNSGTESNPVKTDYDPCPKGWRVPTYAELDELCKNLSAWTSEDDQPGYWFSGASSYTDDVPQVFFPAAGGRNYDGNAYNRGDRGFYWSSWANRILYFSLGDANMYQHYDALGFSVRCVLE